MAPLFFLMESDEIEWGDNGNDAEVNKHMDAYSFDDYTEINELTIKKCRK